MSPAPIIDCLFQQVVRTVICRNSPARRTSARRTVLSKQHITPRHKFEDKPLPHISFISRIFYGHGAQYVPPLRGRHSHSLHRHQSRQLPPVREILQCSSYFSHYANPYTTLQERERTEGLREGLNGEDCQTDERCHCLR